MKQPLVSIIVPIYKVEPYLRRCLDSIVKQTYTNLEIILVDDGSPDACPQICDEYAARDKRIVVIHKDNGGLSDARNAGLDICKGEYISFIDSDDWINDKFIQNLYSSIKKNDADIAVASCKYKSDSPQYTEKIFSTPSGEIDYEDILIEIFSKQSPSFVAAWGKIFKNRLISQFRFPKDVIHEDEYLNYKWFYNAKKIVHEPSSVYFYFLHPNSITGKMSRYNKIDILNQQYTFFAAKGIKLPFQWILPSLCWEYLWEYGNSALKKDSTAQNNLKQFQHFTNLAIKESGISKTLKMFFWACSKMPFIYLSYKRFSPIKIRR